MFGVLKLLNKHKNNEPIQILPLTEKLGWDIIV